MEKLGTLKVNNTVVQLGCVIGRPVTKITPQEMEVSLLEEV